jgi:hypothetical protein
MKYVLLVAVSMLLCIADINAQKTEMKLMQITTVESVVGGGAGRSKLIITKEDGTQEEKEMENLFSIVGINFKNVKSNESLLLQTLKSYTDLGWKLVSTVPLTLSPNQNANGIFLTRYLLSKE